LHPVKAYLDPPLSIVDAAVIALTGRLQLTEIATLHHRRFAVVRPSYAPAFTFLPGSDV
jgi:uncharacterized protein